MFIVFSKDKILSYLISLSTVAILFVISFAITKKNEEILQTSVNAVMMNNVNSIEIDETKIKSNSIVENKK